MLRQAYTAGEKVFVDYAGQTLGVVEPTTGEVREAQLFVGVLGASNYTFAELTWSQTLRDRIASHTRMYPYFGGVARVTVPDNRTGVRHACFYDPDLNPTWCFELPRSGSLVGSAK